MNSPIFALGVVMIRLSALLALLLLTACASQEDIEMPGCIALKTARTRSSSQVVAFVGDSLTARWNLSCEYLNFGVDGQDSRAILARFDRDVLSSDPNVVTLLAGTNDLLTLAMPTVDSVTQMADLALQRGACVIVGTVPPILPRSFATLPAVASQAELDARLAVFNTDLRYFAESRGIAVADFHAALVSADGRQRAELFESDGVHPNRRGHEVMTGVVTPLLERCLLKQ